MACIRSISGLRATLGNDLTPTLVAQYAWAFHAILPQGAIVVGRDGRPSGAWMQDIVVGTLRACGRPVVVLNVATTPTVQLITEHTDAVGGIAITASHNPAPWNGLKFLDAGGVFLDAEANARLWAAVDTPAPDSLSPDQQHGHVVFRHDADMFHVDRVCDIPAVRSAPRSDAQRVVVDAVNCSASVSAPMLLERMGYEVVRLFCDGSGIFPHTPEPLTENLTQLGDAVRQHNAAFGVAIDPDGDRLVLFDEHGMPIGEERTIALATKAVLDSGERGDVVVNFSTTRVVDDVAASYGVTCHRAPVGEINVVRKMQSVGAVIGGEGSGGVIYPACHSGRDSLVGLGVISSYLRSHNLTMSQACAQLPSYAMIKTKFELESREALAASFADIMLAFPDAEISTLDGVFIGMADRWVQVRASNTEPIARVIAEAPTQDEAQELITRVTSLVRR
jgi:phosphomannomutase